MRREFAKMVFDEMKVNQDIHVITGDLGYGLWDAVKDTFPERFHNVGSSEMAMMGMGIGLAMDGKIPYVYSITPFAIYRPFEMIRNYIDHEKIPVNIVGGGRDQDYGYLGFSHWSDDDRDIMKCFQNVVKFHPNDNIELEEAFKWSTAKKFPTYINLKR